MTVNCIHIEKVIEIIKASKSDILEISQGWTKVNEVVHMKTKLKTEDIEKVKQNLSNLRYWTAEGSPHNAPEQGFICDKCKVGITFPS